MERYFNMNPARDNPLPEIIKKSKNRFSKFCVPAHKGSRKFSIKNAFDLTETDYTDNLFFPANGGYIEGLNKKISDIYKSGKSFVLPFGTTLSLRVMLSLFLFEGDTLLCGENIHRSVIDTANLLKIKLVLVPVTDDNRLMFELINGNILKNIRYCLITSPDYFGNISDISETAAILKKSGIRLLVDNAHGSHLILSKNHPLSFDAFAVCDSLFKTLPALTGASVLQIGRAHV